MAPMNMEPNMDIPRQNMVPAQYGLFSKIVIACSEICNMNGRYMNAIQRVGHESTLQLFSPETGCQKEERC